jgi:hypothetical protein
MILNVRTERERQINATRITVTRKETQKRRKISSGTKKWKNTHLSSIDVKASHLENRECDCRFGLNDFAEWTIALQCIRKYLFRVLQLRKNRNKRKHRKKKEEKKGGKKRKLENWETSKFVVDRRK